MIKRSAGILMFRREGSAIELLLVHPGGPFWARKDAGAWSIPKGEYEMSEDPRSVAKREFEEELGAAPPANGYLDLGEITQPSRKVVTVFAVAGDFDPSRLKSNSFELEWPPKSGRNASFPEVDRAQWFSSEEAKGKILPGQRPFIDRLLARLGSPARA